MNVKKIFACGAVTALTALATGVNAADAEVKAKVDLDRDKGVRTEVNRDRDVNVNRDINRDLDVNVRTDADVNVNKDKVMPVNKASGLLGMEVRNRDNVKLGEIKDLVLDVQSGKISYAVLAVGGFLGIGEKLVALPPNALQLSADSTHLMIDADKARIQAAPGFAATAWPSLHDPEFNNYWKNNATGNPAGSEIRRRDGKLDVDTDLDVNRDRNRVKGEVNVDRDGGKIYTDADRDKKVKVEVK